MARLPKSTQEIADVIGRERALFLVGQLPRSYGESAGFTYSRVHMYVPATIKPSHNLVALLGWIDAMKLVAHFGGEILYPSKCDEIIRDHRDKSIRRLHVDGVDATTIAVWFGITDRHVRNIVRQIQKEAKDDNGIQPTHIKTTAGAA
jgi:hypothetical protein